LCELMLTIKLRLCELMLTITKKDPEVKKAADLDNFYLNKSL
jgi:hypothetical protein